MFLQKSDLDKLLQPYNQLIGHTASPMTLTNIRLVSDGQTITSYGVGNGRSTFVKNSVDVKTDEFDILVNYQTLVKLIKTHNKTIELILSDKSLLLKSGKKESELVLIQEDFVEFPTLELKFVELDMKKLHPILKQVSLSIGSGNFDCVYFNDQEIVATNRFQISVGQFPINEQFIVSSETINHLLRVAAKANTIEIALTDDWAVFKLDDLYIYSKLIDFDFPNYNFVSETESILMVAADKQAFKEALERIILFNPETAMLETVEEGLRITTRGQKGLEETIVPCDLDGTRLKLKFNPKTLNDYIKSRKSDRVYLNFSKTGKFKIIGLSGTGYSHHIPELLI